LPVLDISPPYAKILLDREGRLLSARIAADEQWRFPPTTNRHPKFETALLRMEDKRFYRHIGIDLFAIGRAIHLNWKHGRIKSGASTLTMQVIRISRKNPKRTIPEKLYEMLLAIRLEAVKSKEEILLMYTHNAPFGGNIVGLEAASWRYFGRPPDQLSWAESTMLAVLPNNPALIHVGRNRDILKEKRDRLLRKLCAEGHFSSIDLKLFLLEPIPPKPKALPQKVLHLLSQIPSHTWRVQTTLDRNLQGRVDAVVKRHGKQLSQNQIHNIAVLMIDIPTGEVLAYVGNTSQFLNSQHGNYVDIVRAPRSTGSLLKPLLYYSMLKEGELLPDEIVPDIPFNMGGFAPQNYDRGYQGALPASLALARSRNIPAAWMLKQYGVDRWYSELKSLGMSTLHRKPDDYGLALILGGAEGTLWDLASMYHNLAWSLEEQGEENTLPKIRWKDEAKTSSHLLPMDKNIVWFVVQALKKVFRPRSSSSLRHEETGNIAWKTGTSYGFRDAWSIGFDPQTVVGVWVGNADSTGRAELTGHKAAAPILFDVLSLRNTDSPFQKPNEGIVEVELCPKSGLPRGPNCKNGVIKEIPTTSVDTSPCHYCRQFYCNKTCTMRMDSRCASVGALRQEHRFQLPPVMEYHYATKNIGYKKVPPWAPKCATLDNPMAIVFPRDQADIFLPVDLSGNKGRIVFEATHRERDMLIHWHLDDMYMGTTSDIHQLEVAPPKGVHVMTIVDQYGNRRAHRFNVESRKE
jgi:penicillin-binding protein 1C